MRLDICDSADASASSPKLVPNVLLRTDVGLSGGRYTLALSGDAGYRVRMAASASGTPLLVCGQTVTNGVNGVQFLSGADSELYVEAVSNGTATLTYGYVGTGTAAGISCAASLRSKRPANPIY